MIEKENRLAHQRPIAATFSEAGTLFGNEQEGSQVKDQRLFLEILLESRSHVYDTLLKTAEMTNRFENLKKYLKHILDGL